MAEDAAEVSIPFLKEGCIGGCDQEEGVIESCCALGAPRSRTGVHSFAEKEEEPLGDGGRRCRRIHPLPGNGAELLHSS